MLKEFKDFAAGGNVVDMGVGIVIGAAFTSIVTSFVEDLVNPLVGVFTGGVDFSNLYYNASGKAVASAAQAKEEGIAGVFTYGNFINAMVSFLIVAFVLFMVVRGINKIKAAAEEAEETPRQEVLLEEIRDALLKR